jgi:hypothetical protein
MLTAPTLSTRFGRRALTTAALAGGLALPALADEVPYSVISSDPDFTNVGAHVFDGTDLYVTLRDFRTTDGSPTGGAIAKVDATLNPSPTGSFIVTRADWESFLTTNGLPANALISASNGFANVAGNAVQWVDSSLHAVIRMDKTTGALSLIASQADIEADLGTGTIDFIPATGVLANGSSVAYEEEADNLIFISPTGDASILVSEAQFNTAYGLSPTNYIDSGITADVAGNLYWGAGQSAFNPGSNTGSLYQRDLLGNITELVTTSQFQSVTGGFITDYGDVFYAPDGMIYVRELSTDTVVRFDPLDVANTLEAFLTQSDIDALTGVTGANVGDLNWQNDGLTFDISTAGEGVFTTTPLLVPEPATALALLGLGGLTFLRRR